MSDYIKRCPKCRSTFTPEKKYCDFDGTELKDTQHACPKCKTVNWDDAKFCTNCGTPQKKDE